MKVKNATEGFHRFRDAMSDGLLEAGTTLTQNDLCKMLGMSLSPLRETLVLLEEYGLVEIKSRAGIHIVYPSVAFIRENMQYRNMIETFALPVFVRNVSDDWLDDIRAKHFELQAELRVRNSMDDSAFLKSRALDEQLHGGIVAKLGNKAIQDTHQRVRDNIRLARKVHQTATFRDQFLDTIDEHLRVLDAVQAGETADAISALDDHFRASTHRVFAAP